jgi:hypothetical protein
VADSECRERPPRTAAALLAEARERSSPYFFANLCAVLECQELFNCPREPAHANLVRRWKLLPLLKAAMHTSRNVVRRICSFTCSSQRNLSFVGLSFYRTRSYGAGVGVGVGARAPWSRFAPSRFGRAHETHSCCCCPGKRAKLGQICTSSGGADSRARETVHRRLQIPCVSVLDSPKGRNGENSLGGVHRFNFRAAGVVIVGLQACTGSRLALCGVTVGRYVPLSFFLRNVPWLPVPLGSPGWPAGRPRGCEPVQTPT